MDIISIPDRDLIRAYFECLKLRRSTTEPLGKQIISDFFTHIKQKQPPKKGIWVYVILGIMLISYSINILLTILICIFIFIIAKSQVRPNIKLPVEEYQIDQWLAEDRKTFFTKAPDELNVIVVGETENTPDVVDVVVTRVPITLSSGYELDSDNTFLDKLIAQDYFCEQGLDGKIRYSIHVFMVICLCRNFLAYYKCHWNFIRGVAQVIESGEYLYDTIVSVKTKDFSSTNSHEPGKKTVIREYLDISTMDGKEIRFPAITDRRVINELSSESDTSRVKKAASIIRRLLRERRIDIQIVKSFDIDD